MSTMPQKPKMETDTLLALTSGYNKVMPLVTSYSLYSTTHKKRIEVMLKVWKIQNVRKFKVRVENQGWCFSL